MSERVEEQLSRQLRDALSVANCLQKVGTFHAVQRKNAEMLLRAGWKLYAAPGDIFLHRSVAGNSFEVPVGVLTLQRLKELGIVETDGTTWNRRQAVGFRLVSE